MRIYIHNLLYKLRFVPNLGKDKYGDCDSPNKSNREIRIATKLRSKKELEILIHEILHISDWSKDEGWVLQTAKDLSEVLWKVGWRKVNKDE